jgi:hypothetical protein
MKRFWKYRVRNAQKAIANIIFLRKLVFAPKGLLFTNLPLRGHTQDSPKIDIDSMGIAVLYHMRTGMCVSGIQVLPVDHYLIQRLPQLNDLPFFQFPKRKLTKGTAIIKSFYATAMKNGVSRGELMLSTQVPTPLTERTEGKVFMPTLRR